MASGGTEFPSETCQALHSRLAPTPRASSTALSSTSLSKGTQGASQVEMGLPCILALSPGNGYLTASQLAGSLSGNLPE